MKRQFHSFLIFFFLISAATSAWSYIVKKNDTLSKIAKKYIYPKLYGKNGSLKTIIALNPQIKNPHIIRPGDEIFLSENLTNKISEINFERSIAEEKQLPLFRLEHDDSITNIDIHPPFKKDGTLAFIPFYSLVSIAAKDKVTASESTVASKYYVGTVASYSQDWNPNLQTALNLKLGFLSFEKPANSTVTLQDTNKFISSLGLETNHKLNDKLHLKLNIDYGKELFVRAASTVSTTIDAVNIPSIGGKISYDLTNSHPFILGVATSYNAKMPAKTDYYNVKLGHELGVSLYLKQLTGQTQNSNIKTELGFTYRKQDTSITSQTETNIFLGVRFFFSGGGLK